MVRIKNKTKDIIFKVFRALFLVFLIYLIFELIRHIFGGSLGFEETLTALLVANLTFTFYLTLNMKDSFSKVNSKISGLDSKISGHIGWHRGRDSRKYGKK
ncbi:hypothetical protein KY348_05965 [Candidatus Woesearchaeota archaeon]|nr:hypothetical protein [Candidatus Woesearchaeota archaeon]